MTFFTSLTGLNAAQTELSALSNNIANVGTTGFKKSRVEFGDIVTRSATQAANGVSGVGVAVTAVKQQFGQGGIATSSNALDLQIGGQGFFLVRGGDDGGDGLYLSRNGAFSVDADRWVIDNEGRRLQVLPTTPDGTPTATGASSLTALRLPTHSGDPRATTSMDVSVVFPADSVEPALPFDPANANTYQGVASEPVYDADGNATTAIVYYRRIDSPPGDTNKYFEVRTFVGGNEVLPDGNPVPTTLTFDANGTLTGPTGPVLYANGISINHDGSETRAAPFGVARVEQNGYAPGRFEGVGVDLAGVVRASFSNGETIAIGRVALGDVANPQGLREQGSASWTVAANSGPLRVGQAGDNGFGSITSGALERSNVDLTEELVGLISAQRNFQANARAIDTASSLLQTIIQLRS